LYNFTAAYLEEYAAFNNITAADAVDTYTAYITKYNRHCKEFLKTGRYPLANGDTSFSVTREAYDVVLMLSILFTPHRYRIMQLLQQKSEPAAAALYIGLGSGLEIALTDDKYKEAVGYDLSVNDFLFTKFAAHQLNIELYTGQKENYFDAVYLIELLEHLDDPFALLKVCHGSLKKGGKIYLTTATNIPQFDHLYNFPEDHTGFEQQLQQLGFTVVYKEAIQHHYLSIDLTPFNHFYIIEKA
jgi:SAM-dependent methyltransferase